MRAGSLAAVAMLVATSAAAEDAQPLSAPLVGAWASGVAVSDGQSVLRIWAYAVGLDGAPVAGGRVKARTSLGRVVRAEYVGEGRFAIDFVAPAGLSASSHRVELTLRLPDGSSHSLSVPVQIQPAREVALTPTVTPDRLVLGQSARATVSVVAAHAGGAPAEGVSLRVATIAGTADAAVAMGGGRYTLGYSAKAVNYPHVELLTWIDATRPFDTWGWSVIPVFGSVQFPVTARPRASVVVRVGEQEFGPITADASGNAAVPIVVPPGVNSATLIDVVGADRIEKQLDLRLPTTRRIGLVPLPVGVPGDPNLPLPIRAVVVRPDGAPDVSAVLRFEASAGVVSPAHHVGGGVYEAAWQPPAVEGLQEVTLKARIGDEDVDQVSASVLVVQLVAARVSLRVDPPSVAEGATAAKATVKVADALGAPLTSRGVLIGLNHNPVEFAKEKGEGVYEATLKLPANGAASAWAAVANVPTMAPAARVLLVPDRSWVRSGSKEDLGLTVLALDALGVPVPGVPFTVTTDGDGQLVGESATDANGYGRLRYVSGARDAVVTITANGVGDLASIGVVQAPEAVVAAQGGRATGERSGWDDAVSAVALRGGAGAPVDPLDAFRPVTLPVLTPAAPSAKAPRPPSGDGHPWLSVRLGGTLGKYRYLQAPNQDPGPLLPEAFAVGQPWSPAAGAGGYELGARAWWPGRDWIGAELELGGARYGFTAAEFGGAVAWDWLRHARLNALVRYPFEVGAVRYHVGARVGGSWSDFMYFEGDVDQSEVAYRAVGAPGVDLGAELGLAWGPLTVHAALGEGLLGATRPYATSFQAGVAVEVGGGIQVEAGLHARKRQFEITDANTDAVYGRLDDGLWLGRLGLGWRY